MHCSAPSLPAVQAASMLKFAGSAGAALLPIQANIPVQAAPINVIPSAPRLNPTSQSPTSMRVFVRLCARARHLRFVPPRRIASCVPI